MIARASLAAGLTLLAVGAGAASAQAPASALPEGPGDAVARAACIGCHEADLIVSQRLALAGWDREITKMERWGAKVPAEDRPVLLAYLASHFGLRPAVSHEAQALASGESVYNATCRSCHEDDMSAQQRLSAAAWGRTVDKMVRWGAKVSAEEKPALVAYLTSRWGPP